MIWVSISQNHSDETVITVFSLHFGIAVYSF